MRSLRFRRRLTGMTSKADKPIKCKCGSILTHVVLSGEFPNHLDIFCAVCGEFITHYNISEVS